MDELMQWLINQPEMNHRRRKGTQHPPPPGGGLEYQTILLRLCRVKVNVDLYSALS